MNKLRNIMKSQKGFTLVEILVVIVIIGILFTVLLPRIDFASNKARQTGVKTDFRTFMTSGEQFLRESTGQNMTNDAFNTYLDKANQITNGAIGSYVPSAKKDPWGTAYSIEIKSISSTKAEIMIHSYGQKGNSATPDYTAAVYYVAGTIESCTYGFDNNSNIFLSALAGNVTGYDTTGSAATTGKCGMTDVS